MEQSLYAVMIEQKEGLHCYSPPHPHLRGGPYNTARRKKVRAK